MIAVGSFTTETIVAAVSVAGSNGIRLASCPHFRPTMTFEGPNKAYFRPVMKFLTGQPRARRGSCLQEYSSSLESG